MQDIELHEGRLAAALKRIEAAASRLAAPAPAPEAAPLTDAAAAAELARLGGLLEESWARDAEQSERLANLRERHHGALAAHEARVAGLVSQIDAQGVEMQRLRMVNVQLREAMRSLREALTAGATDPAQINRALQAEVEALHVTRQIETAELDQLLAALEPLLAEGAATEGQDA